MRAQRVEQVEQLKVFASLSLKADEISKNCLLFVKIIRLLCLIEEIEDAKIFINFDEVNEMEILQQFIQSNG